MDNKKVIRDLVDAAKHALYTITTLPNASPIQIYNRTSGSINRLNNAIAEAQKYLDSTE